MDKHSYLNDPFPVGNRWFSCRSEPVHPAKPNPKRAQWKNGTSLLLSSVRLATNRTCLYYRFRWGVSFEPGGHIHGSRWTAWLLFSRGIRADRSSDSIVRGDLCRLLARG